MRLAAIRLRGTWFDRCGLGRFDSSGYNSFGSCGGVGNRSCCSFAMPIIWLVSWRFVPRLEVHLPMVAMWLTANGLGRRWLECLRSDAAERRQKEEEDLRRSHTVRG